VPHAAPALQIPPLEGRGFAYLMSSPLGTRPPWPAFGFRCELCSYSLTQPRPFFQWASGRVGAWITKMATEPRKRRLSSEGTPCARDARQEADRRNRAADASPRILPPNVARLGQAEASDSDVRDGPARRKDPRYRKDADHGCGAQCSRGRRLISPCMSCPPAWERPSGPRVGFLCVSCDFVARGPSPSSLFLPIEPGQQR
jgi:hypothetical protein